MRPLPPLLLVLVALARPAAAGESGRQHAGAERIDALEPFLVRFVGRCPESAAKQECVRRAAEARRALGQRIYVVRVPDATRLVRPLVRSGAYTLLVTPFIDGNGLALTHGAPTGQAPSGDPLINFIPIKGQVPPGTMDLEFESPFRSGAVELEIVFRPERTWRLARRGAAGGSYEGVAARFLAIRVFDGRTGDLIAARDL